MKSPFTWMAVGVAAITVAVPVVSAVAQPGGDQFRPRHQTSDIEDATTSTTTPTTTTVPSEAAVPVESNVPSSASASGPDSVSPTPASVASNSTSASSDTTKTKAKKAGPAVTSTTRPNVEPLATIELGPDPTAAPEVATTSAKTAASTTEAPHGTEAQNDTKNGPDAEPATTLLRGTQQPVTTAAPNPSTSAAPATTTPATSTTEHHSKKKHTATPGDPTDD